MSSSKRAIRLFSLTGVVLTLALLPGCKHHHTTQREKDPSPPPMPAVAPAPAMSLRFFKHGVSQRAGQAFMAYEHRLDLTVPDHLVGAHLDAARAACAAAVSCELVSSSENTEELGQGVSQHSARIAVRLPHDRVEAFMKAVSSPLPGEESRNIVTRAATTSETDLQNDVIDVDRRLAQMTAYRDRLEALEAQSAGRTDDLIKVAKELSEVQSSLEDAQKEKNGLSRRIDTERVDVSFEGARATSTPVRQRWNESTQIFMETLGDVWFFLIQAVVWAPLVLIGLLLVRRAIRKGWFRRD
ncbi:MULTISPECIES: DUF4349 domain-containing protein [Asaia]|uniref:DUF4349 domain-containing protein n=1 Tax=Asaia TaxID=91914 RepID=UPI002552D714|nr:DUF4349 domain-containing protein [Asaia sp. HumB]MDL2170171.1 DUF4349 domain-containing protein [Asaia sp. HumB]